MKKYMIFGVFIVLSLFLFGCGDEDITDIEDNIDTETGCSFDEVNIVCGDCEVQLELEEN